MLLFIFDLWESRSEPFVCGILAKGESTEKESFSVPSETGTLNINSITFEKGP